LSGVEAGRVVVEGAGPDEFLKLRAGPGLGFSTIVGLPDGTSLDRHDCVTELGQLWCKVSLSAAPQISGYVSADYLSTPGLKSISDENPVCMGRTFHPARTRAEADMLSSAKLNAAL
jgi:hypothetical protein